jgi:hypothetical protein
LVGITQPGRLSPLFLITAGLLLAGTAVVSMGSRPGARFVLWASLGTALVPPASIALLGLYRPAYLKFLLVCVAPLAAALAAPLSAVPVKGPQGRAATLFRGVGSAAAPVLATALALLALLFAQARSLRHLYFDPAFVRDDYRGIAARIREAGRPGDAVLLSAPNQWEVFTYYYRGPLPVYPAPYRPDEAEAIDWTSKILKEHRHGRFFVLYWGDQESDPGRWIERALARQAFKAGERWVTTVRLARYGVHEPVTMPTEVVNARLGESIDLEGYHLPITAWQPGDIAPLTLFWRAGNAPRVRAKVFVHLVNAEAALVAQVDMEPQAGFAPTTTWEPGRQVVDRYGIPLPADLPAGRYAILVGMYTLDGERLPVAQRGAVIGDVLPLAEMMVGPRAATAERRR